MPQCRHLCFRDQYKTVVDDSPTTAFQFLRQMGSNGEERPPLSVPIRASPAGILQSDQSGLLQWYVSHDLPAIDEVDIEVKGGLPTGATFEAFYGSLMTSLAAIVGVRGVRKVSACISDADVREGVRRLFNVHLAMFNLLGAPYTVSMVDDTVRIHKRS
mmetsp:Transcript_29839/g.86558  ORF Transcript_29839/g.86558 Transcript_29839/m.86558 type:complete len:159 (+) Transcript_29839:634-1110(+)